MLSDIEIIIIVLIILALGFILSFAASSFAESVVMKVTNWCLRKMEAYETKGLKRISFGNLIKILCSIILKTFKLIDKIENDKLRTAIKLNAVSLIVSAAIALVSFLAIAFFYIVALYIGFKILMYILWLVGGKPSGDGYGNDLQEMFQTLKRIFRGVVESNKPSKENAVVEWCNKGIDLGELGKHDEAIECFDKALELDPENDVTWYLKGHTLYELGRYDDAIRCFDETLEIDPRHAPALNNKGLALDGIGEHDEAIKYYDKALELDPIAVTYCNKGQTLYELGRYDDAIRCFDETLEIDPRHAIALNNKGLALDGIGEHDEAIKYYDTALELDPSAVTYCNKGQTLYELGRYDEAIKCFDRVLQIDPHDEDAKDGREIAERELNKLS